MQSPVPWALGAGGFLEEVASGGTGRGMGEADVVHLGEGGTKLARPGAPGAQDENRVGEEGPCPSTAQPSFPPCTPVPPSCRARALGL